MADHGSGYTYVIASTQETKEITLSSPPDEFLNSFSFFSQVFGFNVENIPFVIYVQEEDGGLYHPIHGSKDDTPTLMPFGPTGDETALNEEEYHTIGDKAVNNYMDMKDRIVKLRSSGRASDKVTKKIVTELEEKARIIEATVEGTDMEEVFTLKYKKRDKNYISAGKLHMGLRTFDRRVHKMTVYIGQVLHMTLKPRKLSDLINQQLDEH